MKNIRWTILAALILAAPTVAQAQAPAPAASTTTTTTTTPGDTGAITNSTTTDSTTTQTTTTASPGIAPDSVAITDETTTTELANTGGEPIILSLMGLSMAAGAFFLRRRVIN